ncbi:MAG: AraC family transcriptional regulator [Candidatus Izemoplasmatales bacterium]|jgi:AraC-like DNA-binding protein|nr:AraC family transcriptional regulator [Candidatus Izemoplasmatales bacterium]MDD4355419.1 AraC family transcriptional regulator [Candidatus Izemoplasmatales bacterium]MDD4988148.1 AraC family transcriptional regulator [Candidatus Izemoplasmatales bacterium]MDY0373335.1 AraC family transcriptional regulator [Candidatus Izemoplasmatales bacterium]
MDDLAQLIRNTHFSVGEAAFATVGSFWKDIVAFYQNHRIYLITEGSADLYLRGKKVRLQAGNLYFIPAYSVVTADCQVFLSHYFIHFIADKGLSNLFDSLRFDMVTKEQPGDEQLFQSMVDNIKIQPPTVSSILSLNGTLQLLLSRFFQNAEFVTNDIFRFSDIIAYIDNHITEQISVADMAKIANLNETYFTHAFNKIIGITPIQYVINKKINYAMTLLNSGGHLVRDVAYQLGFKDEFYFSRLFKKKTGISPSKFMQSDKM